MARKARIYYSGATYHVMLRGNHGEDIFFTDENRKYFYFLLGDCVKRFNCQIHAFCLMRNHIHLALQVGNFPLSKIVQNFGFRYARMINQSRRHVGHLFQGRHKAILIDTDAYFLELIRYIHLNPVRAKIVNTPEEYRWSSYRVYLEIDNVEWLTSDWTLSQFSTNKQNAIKMFMKFTHEQVNEELCKTLKTGNQKGISALARFEFMKNLNFSLPSSIEFQIGLEELVNVACSYYGVDISELKGVSRARLHASIRAKIAWLAQSMRVSTLTAVARFFCRDVTGLIKTMNRLSKDESVLDELSVLRDRINKSISQA